MTSRGPLVLIHVVFKTLGFCLKARTIAVYVSALAVIDAAGFGSSILHKKRYTIIIHVTNVRDIFTEQKNQ